MSRSCIYSGVAICGIISTKSALTTFLREKGQTQKIIFLIAFLMLEALICSFLFCCWKVEIDGLMEIHPRSMIMF